MNNRYLNNVVLVDCLKRGKEEAYCYIMDAYYKKLCIYAASLTKDINSGQDIVQVVFLRVWEKRNKLKADNSIKNFLYRSVYNEFIDQYRRKKLFTSLEEKHIGHLNDLVHDSDPTELTDLIDLVNTEIQNLPEKCRSIFVMSKLEGLTYTEIAEYQNISLRSVEANMSKAFDIIRNKLGSKIDGILFLLFGMEKNNGYIPIQ